MPKNAMIHIQKIAPGPPMRIAPQAPTMLPVPTCAATAVASALNSPKKRRQPSPKQRTCTNFVRMVKYRPAPRSRMIST